MQRFHLLLLATVSFSPVVYAQSAQPASATAAVTDANATVPPLKYVSAFADVKPIGGPKHLQIRPGFKQIRM